jgi:hypothetical protein
MAEGPQNAANETNSPPSGLRPRLYNFVATRTDEIYKRAAIGVIGLSKEETRPQAELDLEEGDVDWEEEDFQEGEPDLTFDTCEDLTDEEVQEYLEEQRVSQEEVEAKIREQALRRDLRGLLTSLRATATAEERATLLDAMDRLIG